MEVPQQGDLSAMVDDLAMDMQDQRCHGFGLETWLATTPGQGVQVELADAVYPPLLLRVKSNQSLISRSGVVVRFGVTQPFEARSQLVLPMP